MTDQTSQDREAFENSFSDIYDQDDFKRDASDDYLNPSLHDAYVGWQAALKHAQQAVEPFQQRVQPWMMACFGPEISADTQERNHRFLEESLELVQACGCTQSEAHQLVDYVYGRPVGDKSQEVGGVMVTLAALCLAQGLDMHQAGETDLARIWTKVEKIRAKQAAKPKHSPLPMAVESERDKVLGQRVDDLAALVGRLVRALNKTTPDSVLSYKAMDYLKRHDLQGSPLRGQQPAQADKPDIESIHAARAIAAYEASGAPTPWMYLDPAEWSKWEKIADAVHALSKG